MAIKGPDKEGIVLTDKWHKAEHTGPGTFRQMLWITTGKTWEEHAAENWERYEKETGR